MKKQRKKDESLKAFCKYTRAAGSTYAKMQIQETLEKIEPIRAVPAGYRKVGERMKEKQ